MWLELLLPPYRSPRGAALVVVVVVVVVVVQEGWKDAGEGNTTRGDDDQEATEGKRWEREPKKTGATPPCSSTGGSPFGTPPII